MVKLPVVTVREALRALAKDGWVVARITGHINLTHPTKPGTVQVPNHPSATVTRRTLKSILAQANLTPDEFRALL
jgi:predicted RNA binding protein YcfA (HicA-like mRNA interferase family)